MTVFRKFLSGTLSESQTVLDPDQFRHSVDPDLGPNFCKGYQQMKNVPVSNERVNSRNESAKKMRN